VLAVERGGALIRGVPHDLRIAGDDAVWLCAV